MKSDHVRDLSICKPTILDTNVFNTAHNLYDVMTDRRSDRFTHDNEL